MIHHPTVSIIMPVYNAECTLRTSVQSVRNQSYGQWELILIDDGSTDSSYSIARQLADFDTRIRVYHQINGGPSSARNYALDLSRGNYIAFLDSDDLWHADRLTDLLAAFANAPDIGVLFSRVQFFDPVSGIKGGISPHIGTLDAETLLAENPTCTTSNIICRRTVIEHIGGFKSGLDYAEDQDWLLRVALEGSFDIKSVDKIGVYYASSPDSLSSDLEKMRQGWHRLMEDAVRTDPEKVSALRQRASARFHRYLCRRALRMRQASTALGYLRHSLKQDPFLLFREPRRTWLTVFGTLASLTRIPILEELVAK